MNARLSLSAAAFGLVALAAPVRAQDARAAAPLPTLSPARFVLAAEWLHGNAPALERDALPSYAWHVGYDLWRGADAAGDARALHLELGYLRAARPATTAKGVTAGASFSLSGGPVTLRPGIGALVGVAEASAPIAGYDWRGLDDSELAGETGHEGRREYRRGTTVGAGLSVAAEVRLAAGIAVTGSVRQWIFSADVLGRGKDRTFAGLGIALRPADLLTTIRGGRAASETAQ